jgi:hypothetical protein
LVRYIFFLFHRRLHSSLRAMALIFLHPGFDPILLLHLSVSVEEHILFSCSLIRPAGIHFGTAACADCPPANRGPGGCSLIFATSFRRIVFNAPCFTYSSSNVVDQA